MKTGWRGHLLNTTVSEKATWYKLSGRKDYKLIVKLNRTGSVIAFVHTCTHTRTELLYDVTVEQAMKNNPGMLPTMHNTETVKTRFRYSMFAARSRLLSLIGISSADCNSVLRIVNFSFSPWLVPALSISFDQFRDLRFLRQERDNKKCRTKKNRNR